MLRPNLLHHPRRLAAMAGLLLTFCAAGCGVSKTSSDTSTSSTPATSDPQNYLAPFVFGTQDLGLGVRPTTLNTFSFDSSASTFWQTTYDSQTGEPGAQVLNAGVFSSGQRGLLSLGLETAYQYGSNGGTGSGSYTATNFPCSSSTATPPCPVAGSYSVQLADKSGGFTQLAADGYGQAFAEPATPMVAATACPSSSTAKTYLFVSIPEPIPPAGGYGTSSTWDPTQETAYGSVDISASGSTVNLANIQQFTLSGSAPAQPPASSLSGVCGPTYFGNTIEVPGELTLTDPGASSGSTSTPLATIGIGASGLLVEDNGSGSGATLPGSSPTIDYENALGSGSGAVGLPKPSAAVDTGSLVGAQYMGFLYSPGLYSNTNVASWSSHLVSFGFSSVPSGCSSVAAGTSTLIYGGSYTNDDPTTSPDGFGLCNFAVDLGTESSTNGLYPGAKVWVGAGYPTNSTGASYSFHAVAIAGQINGKYAIFLIGVDSTQPWVLYLLQSN